MAKEVNGDTDYHIILRIPSEADVRRRAKHLSFLNFHLPSGIAYVDGECFERIGKAVQHWKSDKAIPLVPESGYQPPIIYVYSPREDYLSSVRAYLHINGGPVDKPLDIEFTSPLKKPLEDLLDIIGLGDLKCEIKIGNPY